MKWVRDRSGRLPERPHYDPAELDAECELLVGAFLRRRNGRAGYPLDTDDLTVLIEQQTEDLDLYADLSDHGAGVEGVTEFCPGRRPYVRIAAALSEGASGRLRLRSTLAHELGHVRFHAFLWLGDTGYGRAGSADVRCHRQAIAGPRAADWLEWQAGYAGGALLMPASALDRIATITLAELHRPAPLMARGPAGRSLVRRVQEAFDVSAEAARVRLLQRGYLIKVAPVSPFVPSGHTARPMRGASTIAAPARVSNRLPARGR